MNSRPSFRFRSARPSFTVIELIVVVFLITILMGLSLGAYFRARASFQRKATENTLAKLQSQMDAQVKAIVDQAKDDDKVGRIPPSVTYQIAGDDKRRALIIWTKIRMKCDFPQSFAELLQIAQLQQQMFPPGQTPVQLLKPTYQRAILTSGWSLGTDPFNPFTESAILLYLGLTQSRRGDSAGFNAIEQVGQNAVGKVNYGFINGQPATWDVFLDSWQQPIAFVRWPTFQSNPAQALQSDLNTAPYAQSASYTSAQAPGGKQSFTVIDPGDPESTLYSPLWQNNYGNVFVPLVHPLRPAAQPNNPNGNGPNLGPINLSPVIMSAGPDKTFGLFINPNPPNGYPPVDFSPDGTKADQDNLYGYRVRRLANRGD